MGKKNKWKINIGEWPRWVLIQWTLTSLHFLCILGAGVREGSSKECDRVVPQPLASVNRSPASPD